MAGNPRFCTQCGHPLEIGRFCTNCGAPVQSGPQDTVVRGTLPPVTAPIVSPAAPGRTTPPEGVPAAPEPTDWATPTGPPRRERTRRAPWILLWVSAAVAVALLGWLLGRSTGDDEPDSRPTSSSNGTPAEGDDSAAGTPPADEGRDLTEGARVEAPRTAPPNEDLNGNRVTYDPENLLDDDPSTAWRMEGDGTEATLVVTLAAEAEVTRVGLVNGYAKVDGDTDWYPRNRRVMRVRWTFDDGSSVEQPMITTPQLQMMSTTARTRTIRITLLDVSAPGKPNGRNYTALSELAVLGTPAS